MEFHFFAYPDPLVWWHLLLATLMISIATFVIGLLGVAGGVLLVPTLLMLPGVEPVTAVGTVFVCQLPMASLRTYQLHYYGRIKWRMTSPMMAGCLIASLPTQYLVSYVSKAAVMFIVAGVAIFSGGNNIIVAQRAKRRAGTPAPIKRSLSLMSKIEIAAAENAAGVANEAQHEIHVQDCYDDLAELSWETASAEKTASERSATAPEKPTTAAAKNIPAGLIPSHFSYFSGTDAQGDCEKCAGLPELAPVPTSSPSPETQPPLQTSPSPQPSPCEDVLASASAATEQAAACEAPSSPQAPLVWRPFGVGLLGGFISSLGGVGGPVVLMPLSFLLLPKMDMKDMVGICTPAATALIVGSTGGAIAFGNPDYGLALLFGICSTTCCLIGGYYQQRVSSARLKQIISFLLVMIGVMLCIKAAVELADSE